MRLRAIPRTRDSHACWTAQAPPKHAEKARFRTAVSEQRAAVARAFLDARALYLQHALSGGARPATERVVEMPSCCIHGAAAPTARPTTAARCGSAK
eukprot:IDg4130t1